MRSVNDRIKRVEKRTNEMETKNAGVIGTDPPRFYECGPLLLDGARSAAYCGGIPLQLSSEEYDALFILAVNRNNFIPLKQLHESAWHSGTYETAEAGAGYLMEIINRAAAGSIQIAYLPERGYILKTVYNTTTEKHRTDRMSAAIKLVSAVAVAVAVMAVSIKLYDPKTRFAFIEEATPLSAVNIKLRRAISFPDIKTANVKSGTELDIDFYNPEGNEHFLSFEIVLDGASLYTSGAVAPGDEARGAGLKKTLLAGEYPAELIIRAYDPVDYEESGEMKRSIILKVEK